MSGEDPLLSDVHRYRQLVRVALAVAQRFAPEAENAAAIQVERGLVFPQLLIDPASNLASVDRLIHLAASDRLAGIAVIDRSGHHRPVYRGLLVYAWLQAFALAYETLPRQEFGRWEEGLRPWCDLLEGQLAEIEWPNHSPMPAARGSSATESAWIALALHTAGRIFLRDAWTDLASDAFGKLARSHARIGRGPFLLAGGSDNPETHWYHELVLLHAAASYAVQSEDRALAAAVASNAEYQQDETQPDHATTQPWGLFAFIWDPRTRALADQLLHSVQVQHPGGDDGVSLMLLGDTLYCLGLFAAEQP